MKPVKKVKNNNNGPKNKKQLQIKVKVSFWTIILIGMLAFFTIPFILALFQINSTAGKVDTSVMITDIKEGKIDKILIEKEKLILTYKDGTTKFSTKEENDTLASLLEKSGVDPSSVKYTVMDGSLAKTFGNIVGTVLPIVLMAGFFYFIMKAQTRGAQDIFSFGRSRAKLFAKGKQDITFADVAGVDDAKKELEEVVDFLKNPGKYRKIGARTPKGVLLLGPSGVGKTLLAKALAGEANVPFFSMAGSEFMEMLVGVGASVTGDTPILVKENGQVKLQPIGRFVDKYYRENGENKSVNVDNIETLGFSKKQTGFWGSRSLKSDRSVFAASSWQKVSSVYRHKVNKIYEIHYLGGVIKTTGDHSVFVRDHGWIRSKRVDELKKGEILVDLPMNVRKWDPENRETIHEIKSHLFPQKIKERYLDFWGEDKSLRDKYEYALSQKTEMFQHEIASQIGVSQMTVSNWQRGIHEPQLLSRKLVKMDLPERIPVTEGLMKLFGFYTAEGRSNHGLHFVFGIHEKKLHRECIDLMKELFWVNPKLEETPDNSLRIIYHSAHLGRFFERYCGTGSHNKHLPEFIWDLPKEYFLAFLEGYTQGDGYITKSGKLCVTSVSCQLITELAWLCSMHGIKLGIKHEKLLGGRIIKNRPLPEGESWSLIIGKTSNPFLEEKVKYPHQIKRAIVNRIVKGPFKGFVYDLCGVDNEAFFGGEKPVLLHNSRVRDLFSQAKAAAPAIIFIDEIDAIGRQRGKSMMAAHDEREQTLNQILVEMDGFTPNDNVIVVAATNRGDLLDPALLRPGRFDRRVVLDMPDKDGRLAILKIHAKGKSFVKEINWGSVADRTVGFSGADLENMLNEAAILTARENRGAVEMKDIEEAATKVKLGPAKKRLQTKEDKEITACHEAGHAIVTHALPKMDPVQRISIVARGMSLGHTLIPPADDRTHETKSRLLEQISAMLGGRAAEEVVFNEMTSGAANDIEQATRIARSMVMDFGMSALGPINWGAQFGISEFGVPDWYEPPANSPSFQEKIDTEVKRIVDEAYKQALILIKKYRAKLDKVATALLKKETLDRDDFEKIVGKKNQKE